MMLYKTISMATSNISAHMVCFDRLSKLTDSIYNACLFKSYACFGGFCSNTEKKMNGKKLFDIKLFCQSMIISIEKKCIVL